MRLISLASEAPRRGSGWKPIGMFLGPCEIREKEVLRGFFSMRKPRQRVLNTVGRSKNPSKGLQNPRRFPQAFADKCVHARQCQNIDIKTPLKSGGQRFFLAQAKTALLST